MDICSCCQQIEEVEKYNPHGLVIHLCSECFAGLQYEVATLEFTTREHYLQIFKKLGIEPERRRNEE